ncbi:DMT family transporter [Tabrizicola sp.]|uniref:DMT family transporter n=1 Tax=Tabrizicola sp. TaxID=2005166 RepID=UPI001A582454|nr:DMT family transporter [Tabrizicola sp.]MBL9075223.1 DMT family transporter [Tabrizicola sp.]
MRKSRLDGVGVAMLLGVQGLLAVNQVIIKLVNAGLQPVFFAGLRSLLAVGFVWAWLVWKGRPPRLRREAWGSGLLMGAIFAAEFLFLFLALDLTTVGRSSLIMYSMPVWFALLAHFGLGERITGTKAAGLALAFAGCAVAILSRPKTGEASLAGDLCALGAAWGWALTAYIARRPVMRAEGPEMQLFWMVLVSAPILLLAAPLFGPLIRDLQALHIVGLVFQSSIVVAGGFIAWLWLLSVYPASTVASFSFLTPILAILLGALLFGETIGLPILLAAALAAAGIVLINRPAPATR